MRAASVAGERLLAAKKQTRGGSRPERAADGRPFGGLRLLHGQARDFRDEDRWREEARKLSLAIAGSGTGGWDRNVAASTSCHTVLTRSGQYEIDGEELVHTVADVEGDSYPANR